MQTEPPVTENRSSSRAFKQRKYSTIRLLFSYCLLLFSVFLQQETPPVWRRTHFSQMWRQKFSTRDIYASRSWRTFFMIKNPPALGPRAQLVQWATHRIGVMGCTPHVGVQRCVLYSGEDEEKKKKKKKKNRSLFLPSRECLNTSGSFWGGNPLLFFFF